MYTLSSTLLFLFSLYSISAGATIKLKSIRTEVRSMGTVSNLILWYLQFQRESLEPSYGHGRGGPFCPVKKCTDHVLRITWSSGFTIKYDILLGISMCCTTQTRCT